MMTSTHPLSSAATAGPDALEAAWLEHLDDPPSADVFLAALESLPEAHRRGSAGSLLLLLLEAYQSRSSHADVLAVIRELYPYRPDTKKFDIRELTRESLEGLYAGEDWFALFVELADFDSGNLLDSLERFDQLRGLLPGQVVYHRTGWGEGVVSRLDMSQKGFFVRFTSEGDRERFMPFTSGLDVLAVLPDDDLRARILVDPEGLARDAEKNPALLVRAVARLHGGRCAAKEIKQRLAGPVIATSSWASWWKKAKAAAAKDPFLAIDNPARPVFVLRERALSPEDELSIAMSGTKGLKGLLGVVRGPLSLDPSPELLASMLDAIEVALEAERGGLRPSGPACTEAALALCRHGRWEREQTGRVLHELVNAGRSFASLVADLTPTSLRKEALLAFVAAEPKMWSDAVIGDLGALSPQLLETVADQLVADDRGEALANRFSIFLMTPSRQPLAVLRLARRYGSGLLDDIAGAPSLSDVVMGVLHLAETQAPRAARGDRDARRAVEGVAEVLLAPRRGLLAGFASKATRAEMQRAMSVIARSRTMPDDISSAMNKACHKRFPDLVPRDETPYWESPNIFCTRAGLARRQEEYRVLVDEKIPENSEVIGKAAAFGDLSENYEWTAAIEQQRQLTEKAAAMDAELRVARAIEDQEVVEGIVAPGTSITYEEAGEVKTIAILGPWDAGPGIVSYRAPVAAGMLGGRAGDKATLELPEGTIEVLIKSVGPVAPTS